MLSIFAVFAIFWQNLERIPRKRNIFIIFMPGCRIPNNYSYLAIPLLLQIWGRKTCIHWVFSDALNFWNCNSLKTQLMTENSVLLEMINAWEGGAADGGELSCWTMFLLAAITWSCFYCVVGHLNRVRNDYDFATIENRNPRIIEKKLKVLIKSIPAHEIKGPVLKCMRRR